MASVTRRGAASRRAVKISSLNTGGLNAAINHRSFLRIDYFLIDKKLIPASVSTQYLPITVSDHASVILDLHFSKKPRGFKHWRLDPLLLADANFCKHVSESITFFCETNKNYETSQSTLWDTLKAYIRGTIISFTSHANKL